jgi:hypothetical protein
MFVAEALIYFVLCFVCGRLFLLACPEKVLLSAAVCASNLLSFLVLQIGVIATQPIHWHAGCA